MARPFHFSLQPLLERNRRIEAERRERFVAARQELEGARVELDRLIRAVVVHPYLDTSIGGQLRRIAELQSARDQTRQELIAAARDRRIIEQLRERRRRAFEMEEARREELELDEANAQKRERFKRNRRAAYETERTAT
jgi:flagellar biosynthesis chaperone FliJ